MTGKCKRLCSIQCGNKVTQIHVCINTYIHAGHYGDVKKAVARLRLRTPLFADVEYRETSSSSQRISLILFDDV